ncbi:MAG: helix-turn-helix domain-containing protein, partial [Gammaproteobacteria bacterium]|nr:helix-turn-helix domain-containing protein [Gammaproteobacteria bacterium]
MRRELLFLYFLIMNHHPSSPKRLSERISSATNSSQKSQSSQNEQSVLDLTKEPLKEKRRLLYIYGNDRDRIYTTKELAEKFGVTLKTARKWRNCGDIKKAKRKERKKGSYKISKKMEEFIIKHAGNKLTNVEQASVSCIRKKVLRAFGSSYREKNGKTLMISQTCMRNHMNTLLSKPRKLRKSFMLTPRNIEHRKEWCDKILSTGVNLSNIFFTDEKKFCLHRHIHRGKNYIRLTKEYERELKKGNPHVEKI